MVTQGRARDDEFKKSKRQAQRVSLIWTRDAETRFPGSQIQRGSALSVATRASDSHRGQELGQQMHMHGQYQSTTKPTLARSITALWCTRAPLA